MTHDPEKTPKELTAQPISRSSLETCGATVDAPVDARVEDIPLLRGTAVGRYVILERLGEGGMGVVYRADMKKWMAPSPWVG